MHSDRIDSLAPFRRRAQWRALRPIVVGVLIIASIVVTLAVWVW